MFPQGHLLGNPVVPVDSWCERTQIYTFYNIISSFCDIYSNSSFKYSSKETEAESDTLNISKVCEPFLTFRHLA